MPVWLTVIITIMDIIIAAAAVWGVYKKIEKKTLVVGRHASGHLLQCPHRKGRRLRPLWGGDWRRIILTNPIIKNEQQGVYCRVGTTHKVKCQGNATENECAGAGNHRAPLC